MPAPERRWQHSIATALLVRVGVAMFLPISIATVWLLIDPQGRQLLQIDLSRRMLYVMALLLTLLFAEAVIDMRRRFARVRTLLAAMESLAAGDVDVRVDDRGRDEITLAAACVNRGAKGLAMLLGQVADHARELHAASDGLSEHAGAVTRHTAETAQQAMLLSQSIGEVNTTLHQLRDGAGEVRSSIDAIAARAATAGQAATDGVTAAATTRDSVTRLETSSTQISGVVAFINSVAAQTNLLALNATIEAARAGDAGKGFAVVAGEVKGLAQQTEQATGSIDAQVDAIREDAAATVTALQGIAGAIAQINTEQEYIGAAVDAQRASTTAMTQRVNDTADTALALTATITDLAHTASRSTEGTREVADEIATLACIAAGLDQLTARYSTSTPRTQPVPAAPRTARPAPVEQAAIELF
ncbi:Methyl-accepting chemotaxis protein mcpA [Actinoplanes sp. SE50]|nr:Methyl-accepting chemotaxis protein mcpA [Actinoplanes sp. SE50/110]ATO85121.1 Methyl-accepting chemotaxis protein mcpA [Actinoplanes sp. SE50]SLM02532.1 Methyl-accepting chemotaxis protein mcpA [Actinoplanes sp. SE50/110]